MDPSKDTQYVYAYQLKDTSSSGYYISNLSVGLDPNASPANIEEITDPNPSVSTVTSTPTPFGTNPTSAYWSYNGTTKLPSGSESNILIFTSPYGPEWANGTINGYHTTLSLNNGLPSPNSLYETSPEPATLLSLVIACGLFGVVRLLRRSYSK